MASDRALLLRLLQGLSEQGVELAPAPARDTAVAALAEWAAAVEEWSRRANVTAARDEAEHWDLLVADGAVLGSLIGPGATVVDVGSGAGAPGLALALLRRDLQVHLVEPKQKRAALLRLTLGRLRPLTGGLAAQVVQCRAEQLLSQPRGRFDVAVSRATLPPPAWLELGAKLAPEGWVWVLLARDPPPPPVPGWRLVVDRSYRWPLTGALRRLCGYHPEPA